MKILCLMWKFKFYNLKKPISVIAFIDTSSFQTIINQEVLPPEEWEKHETYFKPTNVKTFSTKLRSEKANGIQFSPDCIIWTRVLGSSLPDKDILVSFRDYKKADGHRILHDGLRCKHFFKPHNHTQKLFSLNEVTPDYQSIRY